MRAGLYRDGNIIEVAEIETPVLVAGATIKVLGCGLCGSDLVKMKNKLVPEGTVLGHEVVGQITELKTALNDFKVGDKVVLGHHVPCFDCVYCKNQNYSMCEAFKASNIFPGGFAEFLTVSEGHLKNTVFKIPAGLSFTDASFTEPVSCCLRAVKRANVKKGSNVAVIGLGSIGLIIGQLCKYFGANVTGIDLKKERIKTASEFGFDNLIQFENDEKTSIIYKETTNSIGADIVFLAAGANATLKTAESAVRDGGTIVVFSSTPSYDAGFTNNQIYYRELTVFGSYSPAPADLKESLKLISEGAIKFSGLTKIYQLEEINEAVNETLSGKILKAYIEIAG